MHRKQYEGNPTGIDADHLSLAAHFEEHKQYLLGFLRGRVATQEQAEDLLQQTFLRVVQRANWALVKNPRAYLRTTANRVVADHYRRAKARRKGHFIEFKEEQHSDKAEVPDQWVQSREQLGQLASALKSLSTQVRSAFVLSRVYGYTYAEIGERLSISPRTVEKHVAKGLATCYRHVAGIDTATTGDDGEN